MQSDESASEEIVGAAGQEKDQAIGRGGPGSEVAVAEPVGDEGDQRQPKEEMQIGPENAAIYAIGGLKKMMVVIPVNADVDETQEIAEKNRDERAQIG